MGAPSRKGMRQTHTASPGLHLPDKPGTQHGDRSSPSKRIHFLTTKVNTGELSIFKWSFNRALFHFYPMEAFARNLPF